MTGLMMQSQEILEKFEFFPIKCRIQRALELFEMAMDPSKKKNAEQPVPLTTKVCALTLFSSLHRYEQVLCRISGSPILFVH
jgi:hypothetical protein